MLGQTGRLVAGSVVFAALVGGLVSAQQPNPQSAIRPADRDRVTKSLKESGLNFEPSGSGWSTTFKGEHADSVAVFVALYGSLVTVQSQPVCTRPLSQAELSQLMALNFDHDLGKLGITENRLVALTEIELRSLDGPAVKKLATSVAIIADDAYGLLAGAGETAKSGAYAPLTGPAPSARQETIELLRGNARLRFDGSEWTRFKNPDDPADVIQYKQMGEDLFYKIVAERIEVPLDKFEDLFLAQVRTTDPKAKVLSRGHRTVNAANMLVLEVEAAVSGIPFVFVNHVYSSSAGTVQIIAWTSKNLVAEKGPAIDKLVSGFQVTK